MAKPTKAPDAPMTTADLIGLAKHKLAELEPPERRYQPMTDYRFAKVMGFRQAVVSNWRHGKTRIGRQFVTKFAEVTELPEAYVYACVELEREKDPGVRRVLLAIAASLGRRAAAAVIALGMGIGIGAPEPAQAAPGHVAESVYYGKRRRWGDRLALA